MSWTVSVLGDFVLWSQYCGVLWSIRVRERERERERLTRIDVIVTRLKVPKWRVTDGIDPVQ